MGVGMTGLQFGCSRCWHNSAVIGLFPARPSSITQALVPVLHEDAVGVCIAMVKHCANPGPTGRALLGDPRPVLMHEVLEVWKWCVEVVWKWCMGMHVMPGRCAADAGT